MTTNPASHGTARASHGIPHLRTGSPLELAHAQGANAATDRAWQIEVGRWRSRGSASAHLGARWVGWDTFALQVRLGDTARRCFDALEPETAAWVTAYVDGVNSTLPQARTHAPEFATLGGLPGEAAERWDPWDPLGLFLVQHILFGSFPTKLWRSQVVATLGADALPALASEGPLTSGSNAWVVDGSRTRTGRPMIAGDPHRVIESPGVYQQVRLTCPEFDVVGLAFPGVPGVPHFGHTGPVAWAITNAMADYQDLYAEDLTRASDGTTVRARGPHGPEDVDRLLATIAVRDGDPLQVECLETARGPVVVGGPDSPGPALSLRTPTRVESDLGFDALLPLLRSRTVGDVQTAMARWVEPVNSAVIADSTGAVRTQIAGRVPLRDSANRVTPVPAWKDRHRWTGYADLSASVVDVAGGGPGFAVHANDRRWDTAELSGDFAAPHRGRRIAELLGERTGLDADAMQTIHLDARLGTAPPLQRLLADLPDSVVAGLTGTEAALRQRILHWDGFLDSDSEDAGAFTRWRGALVRRIVAAPALAALGEAPAYVRVFDPWTDVTARIGHALESLLAADHPLGLDLPALAVAALTEAADSPAASWGSVHVLDPVTVVPDGALPEPIPPTALRGDGDCVCSTHSTPGAFDACYRGPVARYVWDLADRDASRWVVPLGASGAHGDPHHHDQLPLWAAGALLCVGDGETIAPRGGSRAPTRSV